MMLQRSYKIALGAAIMLHLSIVFLLMSDHSSARPVLTPETQNTPGQMSPQLSEKSQNQPIQAVSVDSKEVMNTVNRLKNARAHQQAMETMRQNELMKQVAHAKNQRIAEQQQLAKLKTEAAALALAQQKQRIVEQEHLKQLAVQKNIQEKLIANMKQEQLNLQKQKQQETLKLAEINKQKVAELAKAETIRAETAQKMQVQKQQAMAQQAIVNAANVAKVAGEVDKYKALIINAISQQWILPQNADNTRACQFRIRLAPNGAVLEVSLMHTSGDAILDRSAQAAIYKASPLPVPADATTFNIFRDISLTVRPMTARG